MTHIDGGAGIRYFDGAAGYDSPLYTLAQIRMSDGSTYGNTFGNTGYDASSLYLVDDYDLDGDPDIMGFVDQNENVNGWMDKGS